MSRPIHFISRSIPGYGTPDGRSLPRWGVSGRTVGILPNSNRGECTLISDVKFLSLRYRSRHTSVCNASSSYYRRNPDFSKQNKNGFSRNKNNRHNEEIDGYEDLEESEILTSRNGPLLSISGNRKFQATATPGPREKEIVELFRKVQAQLRERSAVKEEKKVVENTQGKSKESETVDSLLKLLRKHSVQQGKKNTNNANNRDFILGQSEHVDSFTEESITAISNPNTTVKHETQETPKPHLSRPKSNFSKRSPVPEIKFQPVYSEGSVRKGISLEPETDDISEIKIESDVEPLFSEGNVFDEMSEDESSEIYESEHDDNGEDEPNTVEVSDVRGMKLVELRALAKSRGMKGFSKLKKNELIELLSGSSI